MASPAIRIAILANARTAIRNLSKASAAVKAFDRRTRSAAAGGTKAFSESVQRLGSVAGKMSGLLKVGGKALGVGLMGFVAMGVTAGAAQVASALTAGLLATLPAAGVLPGVALVAAAAVGVLKTALMGVTDAVSAGLKAALTGSAKDIEAYQEALKNLSPQARRTVGALVAMRPALVGIRNSIQEAFFNRLSGQIAGLGKIYLPLVSKSATRIATAFNKAAREIGSFLHEGSTVKSVSKIFATVSKSIEGLAAGVPNLVRGFLPLLSVSTTFLPGLDTGFAASTKRFAEFMEQAEKSGKLKAFIQGGLDALSGLWRLLADLGSIFKSVFVDANQGAGGLFVTIGTVVDQVARFLNTAEGMNAISAVWKAFGAVGAELGAALKVVLPALGAALAAVAPIVGVLAHSMSQFLITISPLLPILGQVANLFLEQLGTAFDTMGPTILAVGTALAKVAAAAMPLIPMVADIASALGGVLVDAVDALLPAIEPMLSALSGALSSFLPALTGAMSQALPMIVEIATVIGGALADAVKTLLPAVGPVLSALGTALQAVLPALSTALAAIAPVIGQVATALSGALASAIAAIAPVLPLIAEAFVAIVQAAVPMIGPLAAVATSLVSGLMPVIRALMPVVSDLAGVMGDALLSVLQALAPVVPVIVGALAKLLPSIVKLAQAIAPLVALAAKFAVTFISAALPAITGLIGPATTLVTFLTPIATALVSVAATVLEALMPALNFLVPAIIGLVAGLKVLSVVFAAVNLVMSLNPIGLVVIAIAALVAGIVWVATKTKFFQTVWSAAWGAVKAITSTVASWIKGAVSALISAVRGTWAKISALIDIARAFKTNVINVFIGWLNWMRALPGNIIGGLLTGLQKGWHKVTEWFSSAVGLIPDTIQNLLGIHSDSKLMKGFGQNITGGLTSGIKAGLPDVKKAVSAVSSAVSGGVATNAAIEVTASGKIAGGGTAAAVPPININVTVPVGGDPSEAGRKIVAAIEAWQARTGRKRLVPG